MPKSALTLKQRFWAKVNKFPGECWLWTGAIAGGGCGYGYFNFHGKIMRAHRVMWLFTHGSLPEGEEVCHTCDNSWCVSPDHLVLGTHRENMGHMKERGRSVHAFGEDGANHKLTEEQVREILRVYVPYHRKFGGHALARRFGVSEGAVAHIILGYNWRYLRRGWTEYQRQRIRMSRRPRKRHVAPEPS